MWPLHTVQLLLKWGMNKKPLLITVLSILCLVEPVIKICYFKAKTHFDFDVILMNLSSRSTPKEIFDFWLVFPFIGLLLTKVRGWTYIAFMSVLMYIVYSLSTYESFTWPYNSSHPFAYNYVVVILSIMAFTYFLTPHARRPFFDRRARLWEVQTRLDFNVPCKILASNGESFNSKVMNISKSGAYIRDAWALNAGELVDLEFDFMGGMVAVRGKIVHLNPSCGENGFGLAFKLKRSEKKRIAKIVNIIKLSKAAIKEESRAAA